MATIPHLLFETCDEAARDAIDRDAGAGAAQRKGGAAGPEPSAGAATRRTSGSVSRAIRNTWSAHVQRSASGNGRGKNSGWVKTRGSLERCCIYRSLICLHAGKVTSDRLRQGSLENQHQGLTSGSIVGLGVGGKRRRESCRLLRSLTIQSEWPTGADWVCSCLFSKTSGLSAGISWFAFVCTRTSTRVWSRVHKKLGAGAPPTARSRYHAART